MNNNFFGIVDPGFFLPFVGENKELNYEILLHINENMKNGMDYFDKKEVIDWVKEFLDNHPSFKKIDDEDGSEDESDNRDYANKKINYYIKNGWLATETVGFTQVLSINAAGIAILNAMSDTVRNETKPLEYIATSVSKLRHLSPVSM